MTIFTPVSYRNKPYPTGIICRLQEIAGHFDKESIDPNGAYSLHTEYSYGKRKLSSMLLQKYHLLYTHQKNGVPQLWYDEQWAEGFADFVIALVGNHAAPRVIEIHPPFSDYCKDIDSFINRYHVFEGIIRKHYPDTEICLENRAGTIYRGGRFLISDIDNVCNAIEAFRECGLELKMVLDYPQLFTAEHYNLECFPLDDFLRKHERLQSYKDSIRGIHIWGKYKNAAGRWVAHAGDLNSLFDGNYEVKDAILDMINGFYDDGQVRFFVPEVNSTPAHLLSIINDFLKHGMQFY